MVECKKFISLVSRNTKCYFKDKFTFFMSLLTPLILLVLFATFLRNDYVDSFRAALTSNNCQFENQNRLIEGMAGAWLLSSIVGVSSVTVAFMSNLIMIEDKINSTLNDYLVSPVKPTTLSIAYFVSNFFVTFAVIMCVMLIGHIYLAAVGWYISVGDAFMIIVDCICCILFGTLFAGVVESFVSTQGGLSAVVSLVSSMYGFLCGAFMPISTFSAGLRNVLGLLPGTYSIGILRNHYLGGYVYALADEGVSVEVLEGIKDSFDANLYLFGHQIPLGAMYGILLGACGVLLIAYITIVILKTKKK